MTPSPFRLHPFLSGAGGSPDSAELQLGGELRLLPAARPILQLELRLKGALEEVRLAPAADVPVRRDELWRTTCFEFFLAAPRQPSYWEFNLSPSGDWNVYRFSSYRAGQSPEPFYGSLPFEVRCTPTCLELFLRCPLPPGAVAGCGIEAAVTAVIENLKGEHTYWALHHPGPEPDFHNRKGFLLWLDQDPRGIPGSAAQKFRHQPRP